VAEQAVVGQPEQPDGGEAVGEPADLGDGVAELAAGLQVGDVGTRRSTISRVMAMAKTASLEKRIRSYSISPALARTRQRLEGAAMGGV
jgi:hypothetical protein